MNPDNKTVRHLEPAKTLGERIRRMRFTLARRASQLVVLGLFFGTARWGWEIGGKPILSGDLSASRILETLPLADPLALLERLAAGVMPSAAALTGAAIVLALYGALGARIFCGWVCPMNIVVDAAQWLRRKLGLSADLVRLSRKTRYVVLAGVLLASATTGSAAFEFLSPQAMLWRDLVWGTGLSALTSALAVFAIELVLMRDGWCGHLCPLGAFWGCVGHVQKRPLLKLAFERASCTRCGDCLQVCPERQIIRFKTLEAIGRVPSAECIGCGRCIAVCPENALRFTLCTKAQPAAQSDQRNPDAR